MIRIKAYVKRLSERNYLVNLRPSDIPINKIILKEPVYLTKGEIEKIVEYLDKWVETAKKKRMRNHKFPAYKRRALVRMLYTTGLRNAEVRTLKMEYMDLDRMTGNIV